MPTVSEPNAKEETKPQIDTPVPAQPELFAAEIAMEQKSSNFFPLLLIAALVVVVGGTIYYFVKGTRDVLSVSAATTSVGQVLNAQGPATVRFNAGNVQKPVEPHYVLLSKAGVIEMKPKGATSVNVTVIPAGQTLLGMIDGVQKGKNAAGATTYLVPLATRSLVTVDKVTMLRPHLARVDYTWKWSPNRLGREFDAAGSLVQSFKTWDRETLIKSYGVDFYGAAPTKASIVLMESNDGTWKPYTE